MKFLIFCAHFSVQTELLIQAQLTRESVALSSALLGDFRRVLELAPRLLEELMKVIFVHSGLWQTCKDENGI